MEIISCKTNQFEFLTEQTQQRTRFSYIMTCNDMYNAYRGVTDTLLCCSFDATYTTCFFGVSREVFLDRVGDESIKDLPEMKNRNGTTLSR